MNSKLSELTANTIREQCAKIAAIREEKWEDELKFMDHFKSLYDKKKKLGLIMSLNLASAYKNYYEK